jgi:hypothetical protein
MDNIIRPYRYFIQKGEAYCPKCGKGLGEERRLERTVCHGGWFRKCPKDEHFHHKCRHCSGQWLESTMEMHEREVKFTIKNMVEIAMKSSMTSEEIKNYIDELVVKSVMES